MGDCLLPGPPLTEKIQNFTSNRIGGNRQSPSEIMETQSPILPISEQTPRPPQLDIIPHLFGYGSTVEKSEVAASHRLGIYRLLIAKKMRKMKTFQFCCNFLQVQHELFVSFIEFLELSTG
jgi:hypothetical protein